MRRGDITNRQGVSVLLDYRCLAYSFDVPRRGVLGFFGRSTRSWATHSFAPQFLSRHPEITFDAVVINQQAEQSKLVSALRDLQLRAVLEIDDAREVLRLVDTAGYLTFLTTDPALVLPDGRSQFFGGLSHRFV